MSDAIFNIIQIGQQADTTTAVPAAVLFPVDAGAVIDADRSPSNPEEDYGQNAMAQPGRGHYGLRAASLSITGDVRAEDFPEILEMHAAGGIVAGGGAGAYTWDYTWDIDEDTKTRYTIEGGAVDTANDQWRAVGCLVDTLEIGFDALTAPGNAPWKFTAGVEALYREQHALTPALSAPSTLETFEGHMTSMYEGATGTAFGSLAELTGSLKSFKLSSTLGLARRAYGGIVDYASAWGQAQRKALNFTAEIAINATSKSNIHDVYETAGSLMTERRWRILTRGSRLTTQNEVQVATINGAPTGGTFTLSFEGATTTPLAYDVAAADVQTALRALATINGANVTATGSAGGPYTITFIGNRASLPQLLIQAAYGGLTGGTAPTVTVARTQAGGQLKTLRQDMRVRFNTVNVGNVDGERLYTVEGIVVSDPTLGSDGFTSVLNGVSVLPSA